MADMVAELQRWLEEHHQQLDIVHNQLCWIMIGAAVATFASLMTGLTAPYGRYSRQKWGFMIDARLAWMTQELPSLLLVAGLAYLAGPSTFLNHATSVRTVMTAAFLAHYSYRALLFPLLIRGGKSTPSSVWLMSFVFCLWNGFLQGWYLSRQQPDGPLTTRALLGLNLWMAGWLIVMQSDSILRNLRKHARDTGYQIPHGGAFEYVSAANYFGEILEWTGYAVSTWSLPGFAFAFFTFCNLAPRGHEHHKWYKAKFDDYPKTRHAVIPFIW